MLASLGFEQLDPVLLLLRRFFNATRHQRQMETTADTLYMCVCTALLSWITHSHLVSLSVTKRRPVHFILNPGHVEYELGLITMVWTFSQPEQSSNLRPSSCRLRALTTRPPSPLVFCNDYLIFKRFSHDVIIRWWSRWVRWHKESRCCYFVIYRRRGRYIYHAVYSFSVIMFFIAINGISTISFCRPRQTHSSHLKRDYWFTM